MIEQSDIIYFLFTDRFYNGCFLNDYNLNPEDPQGYHGGDFEGIIKKLPYLKTLGVTAIWITPVYQNIEYTQDPKFRYRSYHGYWPLDFDKVDRHLYTPGTSIPDGDMRHLRVLSDELHKNGLKLVLDMVINHTGYEHHWVHERPDWFHPPGYTDDIRRYLFGLPDLDLSNPDVIDYFIHNIINWVKIGKIDGIRMDAVKHIDKPFWYHLKASLRGACPGVSIFGEAFDYNIEGVSQYQNFFDFDSMIDFPLKNIMYEDFVNEEPFTKIARPRLSDDESPGILDLDICYNNPYKLITFLDNHDSVRFMTSLLNKYGYEGDGRKTAIETYKEAFTFLFTCRGIPQLFYGDEIGLEGGIDPDNRRDMPWEIFKNNKPDKKKAPESRDIYEHIQKLIALRKENSALRHGTFLTLWVNHSIIVFLRCIEDSIVVCAFNNGRDGMEKPVVVPYWKNVNIPKRIRNIMASRETVRSSLDTGNVIVFDDEGFTMELGGKQGDIFVVS